jgi:hypothetical protein
MDIPGLDPDKNTIQMDIFPTDLVSNIVVSKSFTADQPADFTGGLLNIETKAFPDKKIGSFSISTSYNPAMNLNPNYLTYQGGKLDFLGFDDGTRRLPAGARASQIPTPIFFPTNEVNAFVQSFNPTLGAIKRMSLMDMSLGYSAGNQWEGKKLRIPGRFPSSAMYSRLPTRTTTRFTTMCFTENTSAIRTQMTTKCGTPPSKQANWVNKAP